MKLGAATHAYKARKAEARGQSSIATWVRCKKRREEKRYLAGGSMGCETGWTKRRIKSGVFKKRQSDSSTEPLHHFSSKAREL